MTVHYDISETRIQGLCNATPNGTDGFVYLDTTAPQHCADVDCPECQRRFAQRWARKTALPAERDTAKMDESGLLWA